jgi:hypothetical protein
VLPTAGRLLRLASFWAAAEERSRPFGLGLELELGGRSPPPSAGRAVVVEKEADAVWWTVLLKKVAGVLLPRPRPRAATWKAWRFIVGELFARSWLAGGGPQARGLEVPVVVSSVGRWKRNGLELKMLIGGCDWRVLVGVEQFGDPCVC